MCRDEGVSVNGGQPFRGFSTYRWTGFAVMCDGNSQGPVCYRTWCVVCGVPTVGMDAALF